MPPAKKAAAPRRAAPQRKFIRNIRYMQVSVRLDTGRRLELQPRGQRGDTIPVKKDEIEDPKFELNRDILFEVITQTEAERTLEKQGTNNQQATLHPALSQIRNAKGEEYESAPTVRSDEEAQGTQVGTIDDRGMITRAQSVGTTDNPIKERVSEQDALEAQDEVARRTDLEGPQAGLGNLRVTKGDVQGT